MPLRFTSIPLVKEFFDDDPPFRPYDLAAADFNQDNVLDIISDRNVFLGDGLGGFREVVLPDAVQAALETATQRATTDLNRDGKADVIALTPGGVTVLLGDGNGSFNSIQPFATGTNSVTFAIADVNQDKIPDLITANSGTPQDRSTQTLSVLLGTDNGTLQAAKAIAVPGRPLDAVGGDFNGDGKTDLVALSRQGKNQLTVLRGNGKGDFKIAQSTSLGKSYYSHVVADDFNKDGRTDVAYATNERVRIFLGTRRGMLRLHNQFLSVDPDESNGNLITGDMNGDGRLDLIMTSAASGSTGGSVLLGNGKGDFSREAGNFEASVPDDRSDMTNAFDIVRGDFNGDGKFDLATADGASYYEGRITIFLNTTVNPDAIALSYYSVDGSSERSGSINVNLSQHTLKYRSSKPFNTRLEKYVDTVIGTIGNDQIQGNNQNNFLNGYGGNDLVTGLNGKDRLVGGAGNDTMTGGDGRDKFIFSSTPNYPEGMNRVFNRSQMGVDQLLDFNPGEDKIILDGGTFTALKQGIQFASVSSKSMAETSDAILTYVQNTGRLYYNANGADSGFGSGGLFAKFRNEASLSAKDFSVFF
ncbi:MAG: hypothetical protein Kow00121_21820 [Elainellaceae cyanobacterium]